MPSGFPNLNDAQEFDDAERTGLLRFLVLAHLIGHANCRVPQKVRTVLGK
jgi:hypothetical protein